MDKSQHIIEAASYAQKISKAVQKPRYSAARDPFDPAASDDDAEKFRVLMIHGASPSREDLTGGSPLHFAAKNGHTEVVLSLLLERDLQDPSQALSQSLWDPNPRDSNGRTPFHLAAQGGHSEIVEIYLERDPMLCVNDLTFGETLQAVAKEGHVEVMKLLMIAALNVNSRKFRTYFRGC